MPGRRRTRCPRSSSARRSLRLRFSASSSSGSTFLPSATARSNAASSAAPADPCRPERIHAATTWPQVSGIARRRAESTVSSSCLRGRPERLAEGDECARPAAERADRKQGRPVAGPSALPAGRGTRARAEAGRSRRRAKGAPRERSGGLPPARRRQRARGSPARRPRPAATRPAREPGRRAGPGCATATGGRRTRLAGPRSRVAAPAGALRAHDFAGLRGLRAATRLQAGARAAGGRPPRAEPPSHSESERASDPASKGRFRPGREDAGARAGARMETPRRIPARTGPPVPRSSCAASGLPEAHPAQSRSRGRRAARPSRGGAYRRSRCPALDWRRSRPSVRTRNAEREYAHIPNPTASYRRGHQRVGFVAR